MKKILNWAPDSFKTALIQVSPFSCNRIQDLDNDLTKEVGVSKLLDSKEVAAR